MRLSTKNGPQLSDARDGRVQSCSSGGRYGLKDEARDHKAGRDAADAPPDRTRIHGRCAQPGVASECTEAQAAHVGHILVREGGWARRASVGPDELANVPVDQCVGQAENKGRRTQRQPKRAPAGKRGHRHQVGSCSPSPPRFLEI
jgi:hypothetical protein